VAQNEQNPSGARQCLVNLPSVRKAAKYLPQGLKPF